jgi:hypothetical protein
MIVGHRPVVAPLLLAELLSVCPQPALRGGIRGARGASDLHPDMTTNHPALRPASPLHSPRTTR